MPRHPQPASFAPHRAVSALATMVALSACSTTTTATPTPAATPMSAVRAVGSDPAADARWADSVLATLSPRDRAAQMVWPNTLADYVPDDAAAYRRLLGYITRDHVGGIIVSVGSPIEMAAKLNALQRASTLPLLVSADFETGAGMRARGGYFVPNGIDLGGATVFPPNMAFGAVGDPALTNAAGKATAIEGRALGVHIDFSPVLDVNNNPGNPVINTRSYGEDPAEVARLGVAFIQGLQGNGMVATGKHFPGHGDTETNSHLALPVVSVSRARLDSVELVPFRAAIRAGVGAIMTFHGSMPALDSSGAPGTLSPRVVTGLLRDELGFHGLVVSDAMDMHGVTDKYGVEESIKRAVAAGVDILIQPVETHAAIDAVVAGVNEGRYPQSRVDDAARRILAVKHALGLEQARTVDLDALRRVVGDSAHLALARTVAQRSITVVRDSLHLLPVAMAPGARILSVTVARRADLAAGTTFDDELQRFAPTIRTEFVPSDDPVVNYDRLATLADSADVTIVSSYVGQAWNAVSANAPTQFADWVRGLTARGRRVIVVSFGNPYLLMQLPFVPEYVVAWGGAPVSQEAAARALLGTAPVTGKLPISIPPLVPRGTGLTYPAVRPISPTTPAAQVQGPTRP